jgi:hypothetical protein
MPVGRLVRQVADKHQVCTQRSWKRPFGVGMLVGGYDKTGPHLYNTCPSGNYYEYKAMAIGARSQVCTNGDMGYSGCSRQSCKLPSPMWDRQSPPRAHTRIRLSHRLPCDHSSLHLYHLPRFARFPAV